MSGPPVDHVHWDPVEGGPWSPKREWVYDLTWDIPPTWDLPAGLAAAVLVLLYALNIHKPGGAREAKARHPWLHKWATEGTLGLLGRGPRVPRPREGVPEVILCAGCGEPFTTTVLETTHQHTCPECVDGYTWPRDP